MRENVRVSVVCDIRAFQGHYEAGLMSCLHTVSARCASPGFDLHLGKQNTCS